MNMEETKKSSGFFNRFLDFVEWGGNKLPHPATIFFILCLVIILLSELFAQMGLAVKYTGVDMKTKKIGEISVKVVSLMNADGIRYMFSTLTTNFTGFAPLGTVLVAMIGVGIAEGTGLINALLRKVVLATPKWLITPVVVFAGVMSNIASDAGYVVLIPLGAIIFMNFNRHPLAGLAAAFAGVSGGFSANLLIGTLDPLLGGLSTEAARIMLPGYTVAPTANWFFMIASTFLVTGLGWYVTDKIVEPRLGEYTGEHSASSEKLSAEEISGIRWAGISLFIFLGLIAAMIVPESGILRDPKSHAILTGVGFTSGIVPILMLFFLIPGVAYGIGSGKVKSDKEIWGYCGKGMASLGAYLVLTFAAAQFIAYFNYTKLGVVIAVEGAQFLQTAGFVGFPLALAFIIITAFVNLFMGSASAKWAIMAPIFIPMFIQLGFSPEYTQALYRIGDSTTNLISPLMSYFAMIIAFAQKYDSKLGIGTLISMMLPYSMLFLVGWTILLLIWQLFGLPLGPGVHYNL